MTLAERVRRRDIPKLNYYCLLISLSLYLLLSPLSTYNTFALFGMVESRYVAVQLTITAIMILFGSIASKPIAKHCLAVTASQQRPLWIAGFYLIGPPILMVYYIRRY